MDVNERKGAVSAIERERNGGGSDGGGSDGGGHS